MAAGPVISFSRNAHAMPILTSWGKTPGMILAGVILPVVAVAIWRHRSDLPFTSALSIATVLLVVPLHLYDQSLLLAPVLWLFINRELFAGWVGVRLLLVLEISLMLGWIWQMVDAFLFQLNRGLAVSIWEGPFGLIAVLPVAAFLPLFYRAFWMTPAERTPLKELEVADVASR